VLQVQLIKRANKMFYRWFLGQPRLSTKLIGLFGAIVFCAVGGCSDGRPERFAVSGQVLIDGKPLTLGNVKFVPKGARPSGGRIDENGNFSLTCYDGQDGVIPGEHRVQVSSSKAISDAEVHWYAPRKYASFRTAKITKQVSEATDAMVIELTWGKKKPKNGMFYKDISKTSRR
jgi:hypothetical protein